jgi:hypothetical protein
VRRNAMADPDFVTHVNRIIALDGDVACDGEPSAKVRNFTKALALSGQQVVWTVTDEVVTRVRVSDVENVKHLVEVDLTDPDFSSAVENLENIRYQYPTLPIPDAIAFWGDMPV